MSGIFFFFVCLGLVNNFPSNWPSQQSTIFYHARQFQATDYPFRLITLQAKDNHGEKKERNAEANRLKGCEYIFPSASATFPLPNGNGKQLQKTRKS
jgi:hypothetical protein